MARVRISAIGGGTSGTTNRTVALTAAVGDLIIVFGAVSGVAAAATCSDTGTGGTYTSVLQKLFNTSADSVQVFVRDNLVTVAGSITITYATGSNVSAELCAVAVAEMSKAGVSAVLQSGGQANQAASSIPTPLLTNAPKTYNLLLSAVGSDNTVAGPTKPVAFTSILQSAGQTLNNIWLAVASNNSGITSATTTWGSTCATVYGSLVIELDASPFSHIQGVVNSGTGIQTLNAVLGTTPKQSNIICTGLAAGAAITGITCKDSNNNSYTVVGPATNGVNNVYIAYLLSAPSNATATITWAWTTATAVEVWADEFDPCGQTIAFDTSATGTGASGTTINTPSITPASASSLLYATAISGATISAPVGGALGTATKLGSWWGSGGAITAGDATEYAIGLSGSNAVNYTQTTGLWACLALSFVDVGGAAVITAPATVSALAKGAGALADVITAPAIVAAPLGGTGALAGVLLGGAQRAEYHVFAVTSGAPTSLAIEGSAFGSGFRTGIVYTTEVLTGGGNGKLTISVDSLNGNGNGGINSMSASAGGSGYAIGDLGYLWSCVVADVQAASTPLISAITGIASATALLTGAGALADVIAASAVVVAPLTGAGVLADVITGTASATALLKGTGALADVITGSGTSTALLAATGTLADAIICSAVVVAPLTGAGALADVITGSAAVAALARGSGALADVITASSSVVAPLVGSGALADVIIGVATASALAKGAGALADIIAGSATVSAPGTGSGALADIISGSASVASPGTGSGELDDAIAGTCVIVANITLPGMNCGILGAATLTALLTATGTLADGIIGAAVVSAPGTGTGALVDSMLGTSATATPGTGRGALADDILGTSVITALPFVPTSMVGAIAGTGTVTASLGQIIFITSQLQGLSTMRAGIVDSLIVQCLELCELVSSVVVDIVPPPNSEVALRTNDKIITSCINALTGLIEVPSQDSISARQFVALNTVFQAIQATRALLQLASYLTPETSPDVLWVHTKYTLQNSYDQLLHNYGQLISLDTAAAGIN